MADDVHPAGSAGAVAPSNFSAYPHVDGPTLYRITRDALADIFGAPLVVALDAAEAQVLAAAPRHLPVAR